MDDSEWVLLLLLRNVPPAVPMALFLSDVIVKVEAEEGDRDATGPAVGVDFPDELLSLEVVLLFPLVDEDPVELELLDDDPERLVLVETFPLFSNLNGGGRGLGFAAAGLAIVLAVPSFSETFRSLPEASTLRIL